LARTVQISYTRRVLIGATAAGGTTAVVAGAASVPFLAGFTTAGVAGGSVAAGIQSGIGSVVAGSWFAGISPLFQAGVYLASQLLPTIAIKVS